MPADFLTTFTYASVRRTSALISYTRLLYPIYTYSYIWVAIILHLTINHLSMLLHVVSMTTTYHLHP